MKEKKEMIVKTTNKTTFESLFGFSLDECKRWRSLVTLLCRPMDPASLGIMRIVFGKLGYCYVVQWIQHPLGS